MLKLPERERERERERVKNIRVHSLFTKTRSPHNL